MRAPRTRAAAFAERSVLRALLTTLALVLMFVLLGGCAAPQDEAAGGKASATGNATPAANGATGGAANGAPNGALAPEGNDAANGATGGAANGATGGAANGATGGASGTQDNRAPATPEGEAIVISLAELSGQARFYPTTVGGLAVEVLAVRAPDGTYRTAFNTCQVCFDSGYGYYVQQGSVLICQNCLNEFPMEAVEIESGGCNPLPILAHLKEVTGESIIIPVSTLEAAVPFFEDWRR